MAFGELSSTNPPSYAVVSFSPERRWARERVEAFLECCRKAGADCGAFCFPLKSADGFPDCVNRMVPCVASLPQRCAVFAVNDLCAIAVANAMAEAGRSFPRSLTLLGADGDDPPAWDRETAETISSVRLDHEQAGYLAAKALGAFAANDAAPLVFPPLLVDRRKSTRGYGRREPRILEAMEMIRREACDGLTVAKLARRFPGTRRLFDMRFREAAGHSALDEILNVRMARAMELLASTDMPISAIANFSGFKTEWDFWKRFSKRAGMPPLRFRNARR
jgi:LacI family transcriptional regulator